MQTWCVSGYYIYVSNAGCEGGAKVLIQSCKQVL